MWKQNVDSNIMRVRHPAKQKMSNVSQYGQSGPGSLLSIITRDKYRGFEVDVVSYVLSRLGNRLILETFSTRRQ